MRYLIISDIHANWEALQAVLAAAANQYDEVLCLGDLVGYGPDPNAVVEWTREHAALIVRGNHDRASVGLDNLEWFNPVARSAAVWTQQELTPENRDYVRNLPKGPRAVSRSNGAEPAQVCLLAHGSPLDEDGYIVSTTDAAYTFPYVESDLTFFGHSHLQGGFYWAGFKAGNLGRPRIEEEGVGLDLSPDVLYLINPGSVGQPRDHDPRAAYVLFDTEERGLYYHRTAYDVEKVQAKIRTAGLPDSLAERLAVGR